MAGLDNDLRTETSILKTVQFATKFSNARDKLLEKAPFHFNIIDEVKANENAHSKVIGKLLRYKEQNEFVNLVSFLDHVGLEKTLKRPRISVEKDRIDVTILGKDYAVIIENKIHYAADQEEQISRYVDIIKNKDYPIDKIYVLYLTKWGHKKPEKKSLSDDLRERLGDRYIEINFKDHILPWLEDLLLRCRQKDQDLIHGLEQYIDHLKGMFNKRKKFEKMNKELNELIADAMNLEKVDYKKNDVIIENKINEFELCIKHLNSIREEIRNKLRKEFLERLFKKLKEIDSGWTCVTEAHKEATLDDANNKLFGFSNKTYPFENTEIAFSVEVYEWGHFFCGVFCQDSKLQERLRSAFAGEGITMYSKRNRWWLYRGLTNYKYSGSEVAWNVYDDLWNKYYIEDMEGMVKVFYDQIILVFEAWKKITKKRV